jgi:hypothetical protein
VLTKTIKRFAQPFVLPANTTLREALNSLGQHYNVSEFVFPFLVEVEARFRG